MKKFVLFLTSALLLGGSLSAQTLKIGYINSQELLSYMPEVIQADSNLKSYAKSFQDQLDAISKEFEKKGQEYQNGTATMSDAVKEVKEKELQDLQNRYESIRQSADDKIGKKREELYKPILARADKAIKEVAKEKSYDYVFDASGGSLLFARDSDNILTLVKTKLGIK
jgi:outer membrane protein